MDILPLTPESAPPESLRIVPLTLEQANAIVGALHRHHKTAVGHRWSIGVACGNLTVGSAIVGRPVARMTPQYSIAEVTRLTTDGTKNACSMLYSACARIAKTMGFDEIQTFILQSEPGTSLKAAGWTQDPTISDGGDWNRPSRGSRRMDQPQEPKRRWYRRLS